MNHWIIAPVVLPAVLAPFTIMVLRHHLDLERIFSVAGTLVLVVVTLALLGQASDGAIRPGMRRAPAPARPRAR